MKIKNRDVLLSHGDAESRQIVLDITEKTLRRLDAYERIKRIAHMEGDVLCIGSKRWDLSKKRNVYLLGAGKACNPVSYTHLDVYKRQPSSRSPGQRSS